MLPISSSSTIRPCHFALPPLDASLPGSAGEPDLCPPSPAEIAERARGQLLGEASAEVVAAEWGSARWLPARSITTSYRLLLADGAERLVAFQRWRQGRTAGVPSPRTSADDSRQELIWSFPVDSMLHGLPRLLSPGRTARLLERAGMAPPGAISRRSLKLLPLRYQPERQALVRLELLLDGGAQPPAPWVVAARALPPGEACRVAQAQRALAAGLAPRLLAEDPGCGLLVEEWVAAPTCPPGDFSLARAAGSLLACLHSSRPLAPMPLALAPLLAESMAVLMRIPALSPLLNGLAAPTHRLGASPIHGSFHPGQLALAPTGLRLLGFGRCGLGEPARDLASWVAAHLLKDPAVSFEQAAAPLLEGYREEGDCSISEAQLQVWTELELVHRAAAALSSLETSAIEQAKRALLCARCLAGGARD